MADRIITISVGFLPLNSTNLLEANELTIVVCPHCGKKGIGLLSKLWSDLACPSACSICGQLSYFPTMRKHSIGVLFNCLGIVALITSFFFASWLPVLALVVAIIIGYTAAAISVPGIPISYAQAKINKRNGNVFLLLLVGIVVAVAIHSAIFDFY